MRRMYSENQIKGFIQESSSEVVEALKGQDINVEGITSKGIANTGGIANIGNVAITGNFSASGKISGGEIVEDMSGYSFSQDDNNNHTFSNTYASVVKTGNKITFAIATEVTKTASSSAQSIYIGAFTIPQEIGSKLYPNTVGSSFLDNRLVLLAKTYYDMATTPGFITKVSNTQIVFAFVSTPNQEVDEARYIRYEATFLLSDNLVTEE